MNPRSDSSVEEADVHLFTREKKAAVVRRLQRIMGILITVASWFVVAMNLIDGLVNLDGSFFELLARTSVYPFILCGTLGALSIVIHHALFRLLHIAIFLGLGLYGSIFTEPGVLIGPILFVFGLILTLQYGYFARRGLLVFLSLIVPYGLLVVIGIDVVHAQFSYINGITVVGITVAFTFMFYIAFAEEIRETLLETRRMRQEIVRSRIFVEFGRNLAGVVHNLRSNLNAISGFTDLLRTGDPDERGRYASMLKASVDQVSDMVSNLLFAVRSSQATEEQSVDFARIISGVVELKKADLKLQGRLRIVANLGTGCIIRCAPLEAMQLAQNLLENACEATADRENGLVEISCRCEEDRIEFTCEDNGPGISWLNGMGEIDCLSKRVFEIGKSTKPDGVGLGLYYVQELVTRMSGTWCARSDETGTRFTLRFPFAGEVVDAVS